MAVERHFASVGNDAGSSKFRLLAHDVRLLALRIAHQENLRDEAGGGSLSSNIKLLSFQVRLGVHLHTSGHIKQETALRAKAERMRKRREMKQKALDGKRERELNKKLEIAYT